MFTNKMENLPVSDEAMVFYLSNCLRDGDFVELQLQDGVDPPKIRVDYAYVEEYLKLNDLGQRDMDLIVEELKEVGLIDEN